MGLDDLVRDANRAGRRGRDALAVLQDALMETHPQLFERAIDLAQRFTRSGSSPYVVVYRFGAPIQEHLQPFGAINESTLWRYPLKDGVVVWTAAPGGTAAAQARWRQADRHRRVIDRARPKVVLDVARVPLNRDGYDRRGRYFGGGDNLFRVTSREALPEPEHRFSRRWGYDGQEGFWIDTELRAKDARDARRQVATELALNVRSR